MEVSSKRVVDWDDDDPYQIPPDRLPKIKEGEIGVEIEEPKKHKKHSHEDKSEEVQSAPVHSNEVTYSEKPEKKHKKHRKHRQQDEEVVVELDKEDPKESNERQQQDFDRTPVNNKEEFDPLKNPPTQTLEVKNEKSNLYPSLHEVVKHVDEENEKVHPDHKEEHHKTHKSREGHQSCKKCIVQ